MIRNRATKRFKTVNALKAKYRWCLTGTPIFNRVEDFGSLLGFIGAHPYEKHSVFNLKIAAAVKNGQPRGMEILRKLVQAVCLRRTKDLISDELKLPACHKETCEVEFTHEEQRLYDLLRKSYAAIFEDEKTGSTPNIFQTILRLRQFCNHGPQMLPSVVQECLLDPLSCVSDTLRTTTSEATCPFCGDSLPQHTEQDMHLALDCGHILCSPCHAKEAKQDKNRHNACLVCEKHARGKSIPVGISGWTVPYQASSKVLKLLRNLEEDRRRNAETPVKR